jgi:hypothetical protein
MKLILASSITLLVLAALVPAANAAPACTAATIAGDYGFTASGFFQNKEKNAPIAAIGLVTFDGESNASATVTASFNGSISTFPWIGTYTVNTDCTGSLIATPGSGLANFSIVIVRGGAEILGMDIDPGNSWTIDFKK